MAKQERGLSGRVRSASKQRTPPMPRDAIGQELRVGDHLVKSDSWYVLTEEGAKWEDIWRDHIRLPREDEVVVRREDLETVVSLGEHKLWNQSVRDAANRLRAALKENGE